MGASVLDYLCSWLLCDCKRSGLAMGFAPRNGVDVLVFLQDLQVSALECDERLVLTIALPAGSTEETETLNFSLECIGRYRPPRRGPLGKPTLTCWQLPHTIPPVTLACINSSAASTLRTSAVRSSVQLCICGLGEGVAPLKPRCAWSSAGATATIFCPCSVAVLGFDFGRC